MKVVFHYDCGPALRKRLERLVDQGLRVEPCPEADENMFRALVADADVLWHVLKPVTAEVIASASRLRLIQKIGVGVNTIDLPAAKEHDVAVCNMPGTNSRAVAEMTLLLMLSALRRHPLLDRAARRGDGWSLGPVLQEVYGELHGRTVGLIGYGAVPRILAPILAAMGSRVLYTAPAPKAEATAEWRKLPALLAESDIVSLHLPLTPETEKLVNADMLAQMKPGAILVNTARGGLVDEAALATALENGSLAAAALDVFADEPVNPINPLLALDNVVVMPHLAWLTPETIERSIGVAVENCRRLRQSTTLLHRVV